MVDDALMVTPTVVLGVRAPFRSAQLEAPSLVTLSTPFVMESPVPVMSVR